jgi:hypothetical protein
MVNKTISAVGLLGLIAAAVAAPVLPVWAVVLCFALAGFLNIHFANRADHER